MAVCTLLHGPANTWERSYCLQRRQSFCSLTTLENLVFVRTGVTALTLNNYYCLYSDAAQTRLLTAGYNFHIISYGCLTQLSE